MYGTTDLATVLDRKNRFDFDLILYVVDQRQADHFEQVFRAARLAGYAPEGGLEHIGLTVDDVDAAVDELRAKGAEIAIGPLTRNPGLRLAFVRGPEGIMIELVQR